MRVALLGSWMLAVLGCAGPRSLLVCPTASELAGQHVLANKTIVEYPVEGATFAAFVDNASVKPAARFVADETLAIGVTEARFCVDYRPEPFSGGCRVTQLSVGLSARILLPRWTAAPRLTSTSRVRYTRWRDAVAAHEEGHWTIDLRAAEAVHAALSALPPQPDCGLLVGRAGVIVDQLLRTARDQHEGWDRSHSDLPASDMGGLVLPAKRVRIEFTADGHYIGTCLEPFRANYPECAAFSFSPDGPSPHRVYRIDRLTAGYEGVGVLTDLRDPVHPASAALHRVRLSADGQQLDFALLGRSDDAYAIYYWLKRVPK